MQGRNREADIEDRLVNTTGEGGGGGQIERVALNHVHDYT